MTRVGPALCGMLCAVTLWLTASPAHAQTERMRGPFSGLFGANGGAQNGQSLSARGSLFGGSQKVDVPSNVDPALLDPTLYQDNSFAGASGSMSYSFHRTAGASSFTFGGYGALSDYSTNPEEPLYSLGSAAALSTKLTERISFSANANANYGSAVNFAQPTGAGFDPGSLGSGSSYATLNLLNVNTSAGAEVSAALSQRSTLSAGVSSTRTFYSKARRPITTRLAAT